MRQYLCLVVLALLTALMGVAAQASGPVPKPRSPLTLRIEPAVEPVVGRSVEFRIHILSRVDAGSVSVNVTLPPGSVLNSGVLQWRGYLNSGEEQVVQFHATLAAGSRTPIVAEAAMGEEGQSQFSARAVYQTGQAPTNAAVSSGGGKPRVVIRGEQRIDEYALQ